jgi:hypothetical protein
MPLGCHEGQILIFPPVHLKPPHTDITKSGKGSRINNRILWFWLSISRRFASEPPARTTLAPRIDQNTPHRLLDGARQGISADLAKLP